MQDDFFYFLNQWIPGGRAASLWAVRTLNQPQLFLCFLSLLSAFPILHSHRLSKTHRVLIKIHRLGQDCHHWSSVHVAHHWAVHCLGSVVPSGPLLFATCGILGKAEGYTFNLHGFCGLPRSLFLSYAPKFVANCYWAGHMPQRPTEHSFLSSMHETFTILVELFPSSNPILFSGLELSEAKSKKFAKPPPRQNIERESIACLDRRRKMGKHRRETR